MVIQCGFFMVEVFQDLGFIGSGFFRIHGLSGSRFSRVRVFQGPGPKSWVWVQILEVAKFMLYDAMRLEIDT